MNGRDLQATLLLGAIVVAVGTILFAPRRALGYVAGKPIEIEISPIGGGLWLATPAATAFKAMRASARAAGVELLPTGPRSAFRTEEQQKSISVDRADFAAVVGYSPHQRGVAIDLDCLDAAGRINLSCVWLRAHAARFGYVDPMRTKEPWHWEFRA